MVQVRERPATLPADATLVSSAEPRPLVISWEPLAYLAFMAVGLALRMYHLGDRAMHHDESLHAVYSWYLYTGRGYTHDPMMHGPFQFHFNALMYFLFGDNNVTARLQPAILGTLFIGMPYLLRRELGRFGGLAAAAILTISPVFLYFSRFTREDMPVAFWTIVLVAGLFGFLRTYQPRWFYLAALGFACSFATKETTYITAFIVVTYFLGLVLLSRWLEQGKLAYAALRAIGWRTWAIAVGIFLGISVTLYTTFFTNPNGFCSMLWSVQSLCGATKGALNYWLEQQDVARGGQPWFYYLMMEPLYEFIPLLGALAALVFVPRGRRGTFFWFTAWWALLSFVIYSWAGEKMPWLTLHLTLPLILLCAQFLDWYLGRVEWSAVWSRYGLWAFGTGLTTLALLAAWLSLSAAGALDPLDAQRLALQRLGVSLLVALGVFGAVYLGWRYGSRVVGPPILAAFGLILVVFYVHTGWMVTYAHGDIPVELLVYVQSSQDDPWVTAEIERIGQQLGKGMDVGILMDNGYTENVNGQEVSHESIAWPFEWYLRDFKNRRYFTKVFPTDIDLKDYPVVLVMGPNVDPIRDQLKEYHGQKYKLNWWYPEDYKSLTWSSALHGLLDPTTRAKLLKYVLYRETLNPLGNRDFYFYVRNDVPQLGPGPLGAAPIQESAAEPAPARAAKAVAAPGGARVIGRAADGKPILMDPKGVAAGPDGRVYVTEGGASRVTVFNQDGSVALSFGTKGKGDGQFNEPWGIAVGPDGSIYVADTWNHRIQKFDPTGRFLLKWGSVGDAQGRTDTDAGVFWGPRSVVVAADGNVYVTDTGNKRVEVFDPQGTPLRTWGGEGDQPGRLREPVGLAADSEGNLYVADTWNARIQKLDPSGRPLAAWPVEGWENQSVRNKPYLAVDAQGRVYVGFPALGELRVLDPASGQLSPFAPRGAPPVGEPVGVAVTRRGQLEVVDARAGVVVEYPLPG